MTYEKEIAFLLAETESLLGELAKRPRSIEESNILTRLFEIVGQAKHLNGYDIKTMKPRRVVDATQ